MNLIFRFLIFTFHLLFTPQFCFRENYEGSQKVGENCRNGQKLKKKSDLVEFLLVGSQKKRRTHQFFKHMDTDKPDTTPRRYFAKGPTWVSAIMWPIQKETCVMRSNSLSHPLHVTFILVFQFLFFFLFS